MPKELQSKFNALTSSIKIKYQNCAEKEKRDAFILALEETALLAKTIKCTHDPFYIFLNELHACLHGLIAANEEDFADKYQALMNFVTKEEFHIDDETRSLNCWKALGILLLTTIEFLILIPIVAAIVAVGAAAVSFIGLILVCSSYIVLADPMVYQLLAIISAYGGVLAGALVCLPGAALLSVTCAEMLKTTVGFAEQDSLWDLLDQGAGIKTTISECFHANCSFFKMDDVSPSDQVENENIDSGALSLLQQIH